MSLHILLSLTILAISYAVGIVCFNIIGMLLAAWLGSSPNEIDKFEQACNDRDNKNK